MSLHELASITIKLYGLPEHCGTDKALQELTDEAEALLHSLKYERMLLRRIKHIFPELFDKVEISVQRTQL